MTWMRCWAICGATTALVLFAGVIKGQDTVGVGVANGKKGGLPRTWRVGFHKSISHPKTSDKALRLEVTRPDVNQPELTGRLLRYDKLNNGQSKYEKRVDTEGGTIQLTGKITTPGNAGHKKYERFVLFGYYVPSAGSEAGHPHFVAIRGYHTVGRNATNDEAGRLDDQVCIRITHRDLYGLNGLRFFDDGCDEEPPDEDVLTEEDPPPMDGDPYDGGQ